MRGNSNCICKPIPGEHPPGLICIHAGPPMDAAADRGNELGVHQVRLTGAEGGIRTHTPFRALRPQRSLSTNFSTPASFCSLQATCPTTQFLAPPGNTLANTAARPCTWTSEAKRTMQTTEPPHSQSYRETRACRHVVYLSVRAFITPASPPSRDSHPAHRSGFENTKPSRAVQSANAAPCSGSSTNTAEVGRDARLGVQDSTALGTEKGVCIKIAHPLVQN